MEGSCYHFSSGASLNWTAAKSACEDLGSNLVVINSQAEQQAIAAKVSQRTWIGLYRNPKNKSLWLWVDGSPVTYTNWAKGEPNSPNSEKCGEMYPKERGWKWNDKECYAKFPFVCEKRGSVSTSRPSVIPTTSQTTPPVPPPPPVPSNSPPTSSNLLIRASRQYLVRKNVS
ncbi:CD209 antigen-like protein A isoform X1 [Oculina patagonica]